MSAADELVDVVDDAGNTMAVVTRREMRARKLPHRAVYVLVFDTRGNLFIHLRTPTKDIWPGRWDICIGGVLTAGESFDVGVGDVRRERQLECLGQSRRCGRPTVDHADRERVEQHVDGPRRGGAGRRSPRGLRNRMRATGDLDVAGHGAGKRLEVRLASLLGVEWLEPSRRAQKQAAGLAAAALLQGNLASQEVGAHPPSARL